MPFTPVGNPPPDGAPQVWGANAGTWGWFFPYADNSTQYVMAGGNDGANGLTWGSAKATIQAAVNALPVNGGTVEIGYGTFNISTPIVISNIQPGVRLRGRGMGQTFDSTNNVNSPVHPTTIQNNGTGDAIQITGPVVLGPSGGPAPYGCIIEDIAVVGNSSSGNGITITNSPRISLRRVALELHGVWGLALANSFWIDLDTVISSRNGIVSATAGCGGLAATAAPVNLVTAKNSNFDFNYGFGAYIANISAFIALGCDFERTKTTSYAPSGRGIQSGNGGPYLFNGCWFEANTASGYRPESAGGCHIFNGCFFSGDNATNYGLSAVASTDRFDITGCSFIGHSTGWSMDNGNGAHVRWSGCTSTDTNGFIQGPGNTVAVNIPAAMAGSSGALNDSASISSVSAQTLGTNGAVTLNVSVGDIQQVTLNANATSSSITNGAPGQVITIDWIQGAGGSHTYAWPTNCKFAAGSSPAASTSAGVHDQVTFRFDGTNWYEIARAIGVH